MVLCWGLCFLTQIPRPEPGAQPEALPTSQEARTVGFPIPPLSFRNLNVVLEGLSFRVGLAFSCEDLIGMQSWNSLLKAVIPQRRNKAVAGCLGEAHTPLSRERALCVYPMLLKGARASRPWRPSSPGADAGVGRAHSLLSGPPAACATCSRHQARIGTARLTWTCSCRSRNASSTSPTRWPPRPPSAASRWQVRPRVPASSSAWAQSPAWPVRECAESQLSGVVIAGERGMSSGPISTPGR